jgi:hypothetical protein
MVTQTQSYLCGSAPVQKALSKPLAQCQGERSQGGPAMGCREEARRRHFEGLPFGSNDVRVPALAAKHVSQSPLRFLERPMRLLFPAIRVAQAITWRQWRFIITDEVSRRLHPQGGVKPAYKARPKGLLTRRSGEGFPDRLHLRDGRRTVVAPPAWDERNGKPQKGCHVPQT